jgi:hypothetical protein
MAVHSGRFGLIDGMSTMRQWSINDAQNLAVGVGSNTAFGKGRRKGVEDWTGNFGFFGGVPPVMPGTTFNFQGYTAPTNDQYGPGVLYTGIALSGQMQLNWNWQGGELINGTMDFGGHLVLEIEEAGAPPLDTTDPSLLTIAECKIQYSVDGVAWVDWESIAQCTLTVTNELQTYVNSGTVIDGRLWTGRKAGNMDWNMSLTEHDDSRAKFSKGDQLWIRLYINETEFWEFAYGRVKDSTGLQVNRESGAITQQTVNIEMDVVADADASLGHIILPDTSVWWPVPQS